MEQKPLKFSRFEHQILSLKDGLDEEELKALQAFYGSGKNFPYYSLTNNGIKFCEYVGVIQVGKTIIEVLPKTDKDSNQDEEKWQNILIGMLRTSYNLEASATGYSNLKLKTNSILEMYFEIFIREVEYLLRTGLVRKYRCSESNQYALIGRLIFSKQIQKNLVHQERFFTRNTVYDHEHIWHIILYQAILLIKKLCQSASLYSRIGQLELSFPHMPMKHITASTFNRLRFNRQTERYKIAIDIAKLLLLNFHPDIRSGRNNVLALMFDMNLLWESFIYHSLRKQFVLESKNYSISAQKSTEFWCSDSCKTKLRPDILIKTDDGQSFVLDTKWKRPADNKPSSADLQQLFAYSRFFDTCHTALVYPGRKQNIYPGNYAKFNGCDGKVSCVVINLEVEPQIRKWQATISETITDWMKSV